jgi:hypothetical protein
VVAKRGVRTDRVRGLDLQLRGLVSIVSVCGLSKFVR